MQNPALDKKPNRHVGECQNASVPQSTLTSHILASNSVGTAVRQIAMDSVGYAEAFCATVHHS